MINETVNTEATSLCKRIRATRRLLELSQLEVALYSGVSQSQYSLFEQGYVRLPSEIIQEIDKLLNAACRKENNHGK
jgi:transcriptional regulator with XRE-family HTH domain